MNVLTSARFHAACCCVSTLVMAARSASESWKLLRRGAACGARTTTNTARTQSTTKALEFIEMPQGSSAQRYTSARAAATEARRRVAACQKRLSRKAIPMVPASYWARQSKTTYFSRRLRDVLGNAVLDRDGGALPVRAVLLEGGPYRRGFSADFQPGPRSSQCGRTAAERRPLSPISGPVCVDARAQKQ